LKNHCSVIPAEEPEMDSIPYLRERQLPLAPPLIEGTPPCAPLSEGGRGEKMPDPRNQCGAGKSGMKSAGFYKSVGFYKSIGFYKSEGFCTRLKKLVF
jgi:hypothetical protein